MNKDNVLNVLEESEEKRERFLAAWKRGVQGAFWQKSFWGPFLRADEQVEAVVSSVLNNLVRGGLATHWREYPFAGSLAIDLSPTDGGGGQAPALPVSWTGS